MKNIYKINGNTYITNNEKIIEGDWFYDLDTEYVKVKQSWENSHLGFNGKKIILTDNKDLIKDGVQQIDNEFLEWFVKNPSCEEVEIISLEKRIGSYDGKGSVPIYVNIYAIIIPKEEPKTAWVGVLHDKLNEYHPAEYELKDIYQGEGCLPYFPDEELCQIWCDSKYKEEPNYNMKQERSYSEEDIKSAFKVGFSIGYGCDVHAIDEKNRTCEEWFEQLKNKEDE